MPRDTTLLAQFEALPELREKAELWNSRVRSWAQKKVEKLFELEPIIEDIIEVMDKQQWYRDELGITEDIRPITDARREDFMADLAHIIPFFALRAFSLPADYRVPKEKKWTREMYNGFIDAIVIQPEYLSDDFLVSLGLMNEDEKKNLSQKEKIQRKISLIPEIKNLLRALAPLKIWEKRTTGRVARVANPKNPHYGGYVVFQEFSEIEKDTEKKRRNMRRRIVPHFYNDHYSLIRSQRYAKEKLREKTKSLRELRDEIIPSMRRRWEDSAYGIEEKRRDVAFLRSVLIWQHNFHEKRALDRIEKIAFIHPEQDRQRLFWAGNDIITGIEQKIGKNNEISSQTEWLLDSERQVRNAFEPFYEEIMLQIGQLNQVLEWFNPDTFGETQNLTGVQAHAFNTFLKIVERYREALWKTPEIGAPFERIPWVVNGYLQSIEQHRAERKKSIGKVWVRHTLAFILELKKIRYEIMMKEAEYRIKVRWEGMSRREKGNLRGKIERVRDSLANTRFLPDIDLLPAGQTKFEDMIESLTWLIESLSPESE